eukprot:2642060-Rhodomonas_salina.10
MACGQIRESGTLAVLREEGDSEHSALLSPAIPRAGRHFVEFLIENSGTPECYIQLGVCSGTHDVANGTPAYQSDTGWCFSCHNGPCRPLPSPPRSHPRPRGHADAKGRPL